MKARPAAAGLMYDAAQPARDQPISARVAQAHARARERGDAQQQALRPLGAVFIVVVVVTASVQARPGPALLTHGRGRPRRPRWPSEGGHGLTAMRERAARVGGTAGRADRRRMAGGG